VKLPKRRYFDFKIFIHFSFFIIITTFENQITNVIADWHQTIIFQHLLQDCYVENHTRLSKQCLRLGSVQLILSCNLFMQVSSTAATSLHWRFPLQHALVARLSTVKICYRICPARYHHRSALVLHSIHETSHV